jgi:arsenate reductase
MSRVIVWYNPKCGTARNVRDYLNEHGIAFELREYLEDVPTRAEIEAVLRGSGMTARDLLRAKEPLAKEMGLTDPRVSEERLLSAMHANPILINRPVVIDGKRAKLCRPSQTIADFLPPPDLRGDGKAR